MQFRFDNITIFVSNKFKSCEQKITKFKSNHFFFFFHKQLKPLYLLKLFYNDMQKKNC